MPAWPGVGSRSNLASEVVSPIFPHPSHDRGPVGACADRKATRDTQFGGRAVRRGSRKVSISAGRPGLGLVHSPTQPFTSPRVLPGRRPLAVRGVSDTL